ncbi:MAG: hypothetical protein JWM97_1179 [Phycisphaerales bacterium]|nr:hypothetical protein [Phycisphaerales bacterium]
MSALVLDTHALIWYLEKSPRLSGAAHAAIKAAVGSGDLLHISAISLAEIITSKKREESQQIRFCEWWENSDDLEVHWQRSHSILSLRRR